MKRLWIYPLLCLLIGSGNLTPAFGQTGPKNRASSAKSLICNGVPWFDDRGNIVNAHGACIVEDQGRYWLFGEYKSDQSNAFPGFSCYSSDDLVHWRFERIVLPVQKDGILGPNRVGERVKVMKCPTTGEYVMFMHADNLGYRDPYIGIATSPTIDGEYTLHGPILYKGKPVKRWDMGTFQDSDGTGYLLIHHGPIYRLSADYRSIESQVADVKGLGEAPAMFRKDGVYFLLSSKLTSWEKNDNFYFTAPRIEGPWTRQGLFCPEGSLTYNSQTTFVFPLKRGNDTIPLFMGDRWSFPRQASAATYVWLPMQAEGTRLSIPDYHPCWDINTLQPVDPTASSKPLPTRQITRKGKGWIKEKDILSSNRPGDIITMRCNGSRTVITGESTSHGGYARVSLLDARQDTVYTSLVDFYSKQPDRGIRFITPLMPQADYTLSIEVTGIRPTWTDKTKKQFGSDDCFIRIGPVYQPDE